MVGPRHVLLAREIQVLDAPGNRKLLGVLREHRLVVISARPWVLFVSHVVALYVDFLEFTA